MPQTRVNTPDGRTITVNHPEGATQEQILRFAKSQYQQAAPQQGQATGVSESGTENFLAGVGKAFSDLNRGVRQRGLDLVGMLPETGFIRQTDPAAVQQRQGELRREEQLARERDAPLRSTGAGLAGEITGNIAAFAPVGGLAGTLPRAAALGAAEGSLIPTVSGEETAANAALGGAFGGVGQAAVRGLGRVARPFSRATRQNRAVQILEDAGVDLDVAQRSGSEGAQRVRSALGDNPITAGGQRAFSERQGRQFTRAVLRTIDVDGDELSPQLLNGALDDVSNRIDTAARQNPLTLDPQFMGELNVILNRIPSEVGDAGVENALRRNINNIFSSINQNRQLPGQAFVGIRSNLSQLSRKTPIARDIQDVMFNALERSGGSPAELRNALAKYRNIKLIQNSLDRGTEKTVSPGRLASTINQIRNRTLGQRGLGHPSSVQLAELAQAGVDLLPETLGNSGTFGRALVGEGLLFAGGAGAGYASGQDVGDAVKIGAGAAALPLLLQRGFNAQGGAGNYLSGAGPQVSPLIEMLLRQGIISGGLQSERE